MLLLSVHLFLFYNTYSGEIYNYPGLLGIGLLFPLLHTLFMYLYVGSVTGQLPDNKKALAIHIVPTLLIAAYLYVTFFSLPASVKIDIYKTELMTFSHFIVVNYMINVVGMLYILWSGWLLVRHRKNIKNRFSDLDKINLKWLQLFVAGFGIIWLIAMFGFDHTFLFGAYSVFILLIGFFGFRQGQIFTDNTVGKADTGQDSGRVKYEKSSLTAERSKEYLNLLNSLMTDEKPYLESRITLKDISEKLAIHPNHLSQVINENLNMNFFDFINSYRIEEFKRKLSEDTDKKFTLLAHAYDSGFSSKSSFNEVFKKFSGLTPSQYQKQL